MKRDEKKQLVRQKIVAAGRKLMEKNGIKNTSIRDVSEASGISFVTMYKYFSTKNVLAEAVVQDVFMKHSERLLAVVSDERLDFKTKLKQFKQLSTDFMNSIDPDVAHEFLALIHANPELTKEFQAKGNQIWKLLIATGRREEVIDPNISDEAIRIYTNLFIEFMESPMGRDQSKAVISQIEWLFTYGLTGHRSENEGVPGED